MRFKAKQVKRFRAARLRSEWQQAYEYLEKMKAKGFGVGDPEYRAVLRHMSRCFSEWMEWR